ncbi:hypothetical protein PM3016_4926 [Paenibacillus mucilaginosus 3016]|uniref:Uncharacterized protein n=1 Tax=Paenibacillus mucilaginosus 3016 TaxID=1116391 RepID=H6NLU3_9BACL|nr:hypothetical protein PM3016_4926 [Paenibacillus mucilaginosus 3016]WFA20191.1 hypothetical protein ERY13_24605 [Paenibacillus mucilaginosus]
MTRGALPPGGDALGAASRHAQDTRKAQAQGAAAEHHHAGITRRPYQGGIAANKRCGGVSLAPLLAGFSRAQPHGSTP